MPATHAEIRRHDRQYMAATMKMALLEREHEAELARRWRVRRDPAALHELVGAHARLVVRLAAAVRSTGLPLSDLIQEGNIGVIEAANRFDPCTTSALCSGSARSGCGKSRRGRSRR